MRVSERGSSLAGLYGLARLVRFICLVHKMSLALWGEVGPLGLGEGELAYGVVWSSGFDAVYLRGSYNKLRPLGRGGPVRVSERGSLLAVLYGPSDLTQFICVVSWGRCVGCGAV